MSSAHQVDGHTLTLLRNGEEYFPRLIAAIDDAVKTIYLETYIYAADESAKRVSAALKRAARRGVLVRLMLDGFGSADLPPIWEKDLLAEGVSVLWFRRETGNFGRYRYHLRRLHRKLALIDGRLAFVGGINIIKDNPHGIASPRLDYAVQIEGAIVRDIHLAMQRLWSLVAWTNFRLRGKRKKIRQPVAEATQQKVMFLVRDNFRHRRDIEHAYLQAIHLARHEILISNAYFLPGRRFRKVLFAAAQRGVAVKLLLQGQTDHILLHYATQSLYDRMLSAGVRIFEYEPAELHAKVAVIDDDWATVGSSNIDPFSLLLSREANVVVRDAVLAGELRTSLEAAIKGAAREIRVEDQRRRSWPARLASHAAYSLARLLIGVTRYAGKQYAD